MLRKQVVLIKKGEVIHILRYGLVVRISGSHPGGPGSIPGNGILFCCYKEIQIEHLDDCDVNWQREFSPEVLYKVVPVFLLCN